MGAMGNVATNSYGHLERASKETPEKNMPLIGRLGFRFSRGLLGGARDCQTSDSLSRPKH